MHVLITDSGVGGLSVCAYAERFLRTKGCPDEPVRLTFANAAPENDYGYNSMPTREEKLSTFDRFLRNVTRRYEPDSIYVACNTLSVLLPDVPFVRAATIPVRGILKTATEQLMRRWQSDPDTVIVIFGTPTTIEAGTYRRMLTARGVDPSRIVSQACPGLADTISEDRRGDQAAAEVLHWVRQASEQIPDSASSVLVCLGCTHYGYRKELFAEAFKALDIPAEVVNPNEDAVGDLSLPSTNRIKGDPECEVPVDFITRYAIPATTLETLTFFLGEISPRTVQALHDFHHIPDLF
jgi:glutamate racemase